MSLDITEKEKPLAMLLASIAAAIYAVLAIIFGASSTFK